MKKTKWFRILFYVLVLSLVFTSSVLAQDEKPIRIIFLHHSCGHNLIEGGQVREGLSHLGYEFFDHGYNGDGLRLADGSFSGENFNVPDDNTDPDGLARIFSQPLHDPPDNTFSHLMAYDVIVFKSCFPVSNIADDTQLAAYQAHYLSIRDTTDQYPQKLFVIVTQPPQVPNNTDADETRRAREFADWLGSDAYLGGHANLVTFDFFDLLAGEDNTLQPAYRADEWDAHPNDLANQEIGPVFVDFLDEAIHHCFGEGYTPPEVVEPVEEEPRQEQEQDQEVMPAGNEQDLEERDWHPDTDGEVSSVECSIDANMFVTGESSLYVNYALGENGYASCANFFDTYLDLTGEEGLNFFIRSDRAGQEIIFTVFSGPMDSPVPFEVRFSTSKTSESSWTQVVFRWDEFSKPDWHGDGGINAVNPAQIISLVFSMESETGTQGQYWVDSLVPISAVDEGVPLDEVSGRGSICPFSTLVMPLLIGFLWVMKQKTKA